MKELNYREYRTVDRTDWPKGEWDSEPDKVQWIDAETGFDCLIVRTDMGHLCGYVGVPDGHAAYGKSYNDVGVRVHGGLTFSDKCSSPARETMRQHLIQCAPEAHLHPHGDAAAFIKRWQPVINDDAAFKAMCESRGICHIPAAGRPDHVWWLGFDCAHSGDWAPSSYHRAPRSFSSWEESYKDISFVKAEIVRLARQLKSGECERSDD